MTCIIIEDQPPAQRVLKKYIEDIGSLELLATFSNAVDAMAFLNKNKVELIFLDIHLPKMSGIEFLKSVAPDSSVIFTTAFSEYALESYEFNVVDYLLKPFSFPRFIKAISKVSPIIKKVETDPSSTSSEDSIFIKSGHEYIRVNTTEVLYIKSEADYTEVFTLQKKYLSANSIRSWLEKLDDSKFCQIHKSYIVNGDQVMKVSGNMITLKNQNTIPIGRFYKKDFFQRFIL